MPAQCKLAEPQLATSDYKSSNGATRLRQDDWLSLTNGGIWTGGFEGFLRLHEGEIKMCVVFRREVVMPI